MGAFLVDEDFTEDTKLITVKFGSNAYFDLALNRVDLREVLAANRNVLVIVADKIAVLIAEKEGIEEYENEEAVAQGFSLSNSNSDCETLSNCDTFCPVSASPTAGAEHFSLSEFNSRDGVEVPETYRGNVQRVMNNLEVLRRELIATFCAPA